MLSPGLPGAGAQFLEPVPGPCLDPLRNPSGHQAGVPPADSDGALIDQPAKAFGEYERVPGGVSGELDQLRVGDSAEHLSDQGDLGFMGEGPKSDPSGSIAFERVKEKLSVTSVRRCAHGEDPGQRM